MRRNPLDDHTADRLLAGAVAPADAPPGFETVAALASAAQQPASAADLANEAPVVALVAAAVQSAPTALLTTPRKNVLSKVLTAKVAAIAAVTFIGAGAAAAATNTLPDPAQRTVADAAEHVGLDLPKPDHSEGKGPDASGPSHKGLCNAASRGEGEKNGVPFRNLDCSDVTSTTATTAVENESENENEDESGNRGKSDDRRGPPATAGRSEDHAVVTTPNGGEGNDDAPEANDDHGRDDDHTTTTGVVADDHGGDRSGSNRGKG